MHGFVNCVISLQACPLQAGCSWREHHIKSDTSVMAFPDWRCDRVSNRHKGERKEQRNGLKVHSKFFKKKYTPITHCIKTGSWFKCDWSVYIGLKFCAFLYRQGGTWGCRRSERFIEPIYRMSTWQSQSTYYSAQEGHMACLNDSNFSVLAQRSNSINVT